jgi:hypothetical protein
VRSRGCSSIRDEIQAFVDVAEHEECVVAEIRLDGNSHDGGDGDDRKSVQDPDRSERTG